MVGKRNGASRFLGPGLIGDGKDEIAPRLSELDQEPERGLGQQIGLRIGLDENQRSLAASGGDRGPASAQVVKCAKGKQARPAIDEPRAPRRLRREAGDAAQDEVELGQKRHRP